MGDLSVFFYFLRGKICLKSLNKISPQSPEKNVVDTNATSVFAPDYSTTVLRLIYLFDFKPRFCIKLGNLRVYTFFVCLVNLQA
jgi:hypothetical protein